MGGKRKRELGLVMGVLCLCYLLIKGIDLSLIMNYQRAIEKIINGFHCS